MTQEEKQLLLRDLCARLPYQPMCEFTDTEDDFCTATAALGYSLRDFIAGKVLIKPYLRPMSSMTEEEKEEVKRRFCYEWEESIMELYYPIEIRDVDCFIDWFNEHHFDYRGLIEKSLAIVAPEGMYKTE